MKVGICFGGYCPMHRGHLDLIMRSKKENDKCVIVVCGFESEPRGQEIGLEISKREQLIRQFFKEDEQIVVFGINDTDLGIDESMCPSNWEIWFNRVILNTELSLGLNKDIQGNYFEGVEFTVYVAEEFYKQRLDGLGRKNVKTILMPKEIEISATRIRKEPLKYWDYIVPTFRSGFSHNILVIGTASEGKSTLVQDIRRYFGILGVEEYGRTYMAERKMRDQDLRVVDFMEFLIKQRAKSLSAINSSAGKGIFISDTDNLITLMYAKSYTLNPEMSITPQDYDEILYPLAKSLKKGLEWNKIFMLPPGKKFVDDGTRYMGQASLEERTKNYEILNQLIDKFGYREKVEVLQGTFYENFLKVKEYINERIRFT